MMSMTQHILSLNENDERGYILEVDLEYPLYLHDYLNDYPPCPVMKKPTPSAFTIDNAKKLGIDIYKHPKRLPSKLIVDLTPKKNYVIHYRNLQQCLKLGLILKKVHRVISFKQSKWLANYIDFNTQKRKLATDS